MRNCEESFGLGFENPLAELPHSTLSLRYQFQHQYKDLNPIVWSLLHVLDITPREQHTQSECHPHIPRSRAPAGVTGISHAVPS